jgi:hypothetical protein
MVTIFGEATSIADDAASGVRMILLDSNGNASEVVGAARLYRSSSIEHAAQVTPDSLVLWQKDELIQVDTRAIDVNAAPTGTYRIWFRVRRLRDERPAQDAGDIVFVATPLSDIIQRTR